MQGHGYPTIIRTGSHELDVQTVEQHRRSAAAQGIVLFVQPLPGGGFQLTRADGAPEGIGSTMPSNQKPQAPGHDSGRTSQSPVIASQQANALADPSGTLPSRSGGLGARASAAPQVEIIFGAGEGYCDACRRVAPLRHTRFMQNIGVVVLRFPRTIDGNLCKHCIDKYFFRFTGVTLLLGWWGILSFFYSCFAVPANIANWTRSFGMRAPPDDVDSLRERRSRGSAGIAVGALFAAFALLTLSLGALLAATGESASVVALAILGAVVGVVAAVILFFGIRTRVRSTAGLRRLGAIR
jgi:hypothetical protein